MFKADDYRLRAKSLADTLQETKEALDIDILRGRLAELKAEQEKPEVWGNLELSTKLGREISSVEGKVGAYDKGKKALEEVNEVIDLIEETGEEELVPELDTLLATAEEDLEDMRIRSLLRGKYDGYNALLTLHSGAGGTESCDWVSMLYRMYTRYAERSGFKVTELDRLDGDEAGIKSVDFKIEGENAYGYLKAEKGVHRLVRISPFDANKRRHTSFASLEVMPEIEDDGDVEIRAEDLKVTTFRSSGAGGQHINKTESAIRIQHIPTGIVVSCQNERSQIQNREMAMKMLRSKLIELKESERLANRDQKDRVGQPDPQLCVLPVHPRQRPPHRLRNGQYSGGHGRRHPAVHHRLSQKKLNVLPKRGHCAVIRRAVQKRH